ncbi:formimidoylglutamate deiminase [Phenylobacterium sp.]|uniref:formimidoylglutamate deiminase n=1 Tax=Phenylobacterium sp. TaxID=1871053 RepID=UPI002F939C5A
MGADAGLWFQGALLADGPAARVRLELAGGRIAAVSAGVEPQPGDWRGGFAVPGLANLHSHAFQRAMAGLTEVRGPADDSFWTWRELMYRFLERLDPDAMEAIAALAFVEMLESGFTRVGEFHYLHHDPKGAAYDDPAEMAVRIAAAAEAVGVGLTLLPVFYAHGGFGGAPATAGQRRFLSSVESYGALLEGSRRAVTGVADAVVGVAPHSLRAVAPDELAAVAALAAGGPVHIHAAEQVKEVEDCVAWSGARPVEWLLDNAALDERWCLVHATHLTDLETGRLARSGAVAGLCPVTEANLGDGVFPARAYLEAGGAFGLGTDSNILIDPAGELRALEYGQRLTRRARNVLAAGAGRSTGCDLLAGAVRGGARALGVAEAGLKAGAPADIVALDADHPTLAGHGAASAVDAWIFAGGRELVTDVWRAGRRLVSGGRHHGREAVVRRYRAVLQGLLA